MPLDGIPQPPTQVRRASNTQDESQRTSQQYGSKRQTASQQLASLQNGVWCGIMQSPVQVSPHPGKLQHVTRAIDTQPASQLSVQHDGSMLHTPEQHTSSWQPAVSGCASKQLPTHGHGHDDCGTQSPRAACAQLELQLTSQHTGSAWQTIVQHVASSQPGFACDASHGPLPGHSPKVTHTPLATRTHSSPQPKLQQIGSSEHTAVQQSTSEQPGLP